MYGDVWSHPPWSQNSPSNQLAVCGPGLSFHRLAVTCQEALCGHDNATPTESASLWSSFLKEKENSLPIPHVIPTCNSHIQSVIQGDLVNQNIHTA